MIKTYKILSLLLSYPEEELQELLPEALRELSDENMLKEQQMTGQVLGTIKANLIKDYDSENKSKKYAKYVPFWF